MGRRGKGKSNSAVVKTRPTTPANPAIINQMAQQYGQTSYSPNAPLLPYPGLQPQQGPRQFAYPIASNLNLVTRDNLTPFQILRQFSELYDGIRLCKQSWFDCAANLEPDIVPVPGLLGKNETADKYADEIQFYKDFFDSPDRDHSIHEWMNAALDDLATIDAVAMYPRLTYGGDLYSLDLIDGSTIKPLLDERGRTPEAPFYAYEQVVYGAPSELFTVDELLYLKEHYRTHSAFGFSRVENILMRVNQALRKQSLDMALFTDGNIPAGFVSPAADLGWTPDQLQAFQTILDSLYSGNDALRSRLKMMPPGSNFTPTNPITIETAFDLYLFTVTCASFGTTPAESGFTESVNRSSGESQEDVLYRRTLKPIAGRFARLFNYILKKYFNERRFMFQWKGYEAKDDFAALVTAHVQLVGAGIERPGDAAEALKLEPQGPDVPRFIMTTSGPFVVDDLANTQLRDMQQQAQMAGLQMATKPQDDKGDASASQGADTSGGEQEAPSESSPSQNEQEKPPTVKRAAMIDDQEEDFTGMMVALFLDDETAQALALPGGEKPRQMHVTLAYLGDMTDERFDPVTTPTLLKTAIANFAMHVNPLVGKIGGVLRFTSVPDGELTPVCASVDVPGLSELRNDLVKRLEAIGYPADTTHGYTPHITLAYIDADAPMPIHSVPNLPLAFLRIWLCIGNDRYEYKIGSDQEVVQLARADLRKWRDNAISRLKTGKPLRAFVSSTIPSGLHGRIERALNGCDTPDEVKLVFASVQDHQLRPFTRATRQWRQPPPEQLQCEQQLAEALKTLVKSGTRDGRTLSYADVDRHAVAQRIAPYLEQAQALGKRFAEQQLTQIERSSGTASGNTSHSRDNGGISSGIASGLALLVGKAVDLVERALNWAVSLFQEQVDGLSDDASEEDIEAVLDSVAEQIAETLAPTDIQTEVESQVMGILEQAGVAQIECVNEPDACEVCVENAEQGPIPLGSAFASGHSQPPFHYRCRCHVQAVQ